jgi:CO/xanthine dehydrogenase FAD-binding subunit
MDLPQVETYLQPTKFDRIPDWQPGWFWLAGGTWIFSEPETRAKGLVDLEPLNWSAIEVLSSGLAIGATFKLVDIANFPFPPTWTATQALKRAVEELASFKISNVATVGGNLCLALPASTFAPVMVALDATYEILPPHTPPRFIPASKFQIGAQQTLLQPGEALRKILIPATYLSWQVRFQRVCLQTTGYALAIVVTAYHPPTQQVRYAIGASTPTPRLLTFDHPPTLLEITQTLTSQISDFIQDDRASAAYRQHITQVLMTRSLQEIITVSD